MIVNHFIGKKVLSAKQNSTMGISMSCELDGGAIGTMEMVVGNWGLFDKWANTHEDPKLIVSDYCEGEKSPLLSCLVGDHIVKVSAVYRGKLEAPGYGFHVVVKFGSGKRLYFQPYSLLEPCERTEFSSKPGLFHAELLTLMCPRGTQIFEFSGNVRLNLKWKPDEGTEVMSGSDAVQD